MKEIINSERDLLTFLESLTKIKFIESKSQFYIEDKIIKYDLILPLSVSDALSGKFTQPVDKYHLHFKNCEFIGDINIRDLRKKSDLSQDNIDDEKIDYEFSECEFNNEKINIGNSNKNITFSGNKTFTKELNMEDADLTGKIRFRGCIFNKVNLQNTKFKDLADFWNCVFTQRTIFYKTDFYGTTVFSSATFEENVLFTYSLINKVIIFRGTVFNKGLDLSTAILTGTISYFDVKLTYFKSNNKKLSKGQYESLISDDAEIPIKNKRETFRILKKNYESLSNNSESLEIKELEMRTLLDEIGIKILQAKGGWKKIPNYFLLLLNKYSNSYGNSYIKGIFFTIIIGILFFYLSSVFTAKFEPCRCINIDTILEGSKYFWQFLLPTHRFDYIEVNPVSKRFYFYDFFGRIAVGYGIYQTIQAFRKYK